MSTNEIRDDQQQTGELTPEQDRGHGFLRFYWMALGNFGLLVLAGLIGKQDPWTLTLLDAGYFVVLMSLLGARYVDITRFQGDTAHGEPATKSHLARYAAGMAAFGAALWALVQSVNV